MGTRAKEGGSGVAACENLVSPLVLFGSPLATKLCLGVVQDPNAGFDLQRVAADCVGGSERRAGGVSRVRAGGAHQLHQLWHLGGVRHPHALHGTARTTDLMRSGQGAALSFTLSCVDAWIMWWWAGECVIPPIAQATARIHVSADRCGTLSDGSAYGKRNCALSVSFGVVLQSAFASVLSLIGTIVEQVTGRSYYFATIGVLPPGIIYMLQALFSLWVRARCRCRCRCRAAVGLAVRRCISRVLLGVWEMLMEGVI
jgi:hypothetical protein